MRVWLKILSKCFNSHYVRNNISLTNNIIKDKQERIIEYLKQINLLKEDIFNAYNINITGIEKYNIAFLETDNSLHGIDKPFVIWYVST